MTSSLTRLTAAKHRYRLRTWLHASGLHQWSCDYMIEVPQGWAIWHHGPLCWTSAEAIRRAPR